MLQCQSFSEGFTSVYRSAGGMRRGYMGHLTRIANTVVHNLEKGPVHAQISSLIAGLCAETTTVQSSKSSHLLSQCHCFVFVGVELPEDCRGRWETFVDQTLSEANRKNTIDLVIMHTLFSIKN